MYDAEVKWRRTAGAVQKGGLCNDTPRMIASEIPGVTEPRVSWGRVISGFQREVELGGVAEAECSVLSWTLTLLGELDARGCIRHCRCLCGMMRRIAL